ncbi:AMP-binding protein [Streptomyces sp. Edi2]|uniref:AMP-binding protein n=1 Tax=Streptomyces sp. Edi2 TaxID=3162528 RepID=UPI0033066EDD
MSMIQSLVASIERHSQSIAVVDHGKSYTYGDLDQLSAEMCGGLVEKGIGQGDLVCLYDTRSWLRCAAVLGAWRAGAGVLSIDPSMPAARTQRILNSAGPTLVLHDEIEWHIDSDLPRYNYSKVRSRPRRQLADAEVAYVIATSGSTGEPKSVAVPPVVLEHLAAWHVEHWDHTALPHTLHASSIGFDVIYEDMVATWSSGAKLVIADDQERRDPFEVMQLALSNEVSRLFMPVGALHSLALVATATDTKLPALQEIAVAGEKLVINDEVREFCGKSEIGLINQYGPSETHLVTQYRLAGDPEAWPDFPPIGTAVVSAELLMSDGERLRPFRSMEEGELVISGRCVATGYLGDRQLTEEKFRNIRHQDGRKLRCYFTGDRVLFDGDNFHFIARVDDQLKMNGYRVEPGEVEAAIVSLPGVRRAVVVGDRKADRLNLVAYYTAEQGTEVTPSDVRDACLHALPEYMVPSEFVALKDFPLTPNGKVDRRALAGNT